jgi:hypothetical protein
MDKKNWYFSGKNFGILNNGKNFGILMVNH